MNLLLFNLRVDRDHTALGFTTDWINELARHFDRVTVITMYRGVVAVADNVEVMSAGLERGLSKPHRVFNFYRLLAGALRRREFDCCFSHMMPLFTLLAGPVLKAKRIPVALWYAHNHRPAILPAALAFADRALASTRTAFPIATNKLRVIGQGIDTGRFRPQARAMDDPVLRMITIGRTSKIKNIDLMIRALVRLRDALPGLPVRFVIVGEPLSGQDQAYVDSCRELAASLGIDDLVEWQAPVSFAEVHTAYYRGDIFLSANDNGLDKAILEAMASGLAVVAMHPALEAPLGPYYAKDESAFGESLINLASLDHQTRRTIGSRLRRYVESEHSLAQLGRRVAAELKAIAR